MTPIFQSLRLIVHANGVGISSFHVCLKNFQKQNEFPVPGKVNPAQMQLSAQYNLGGRIISSSSKLHFHLLFF